ncbi:nuclear transport factor 2 family protein [Novosphingobium sp. JCM 18896]|uniref:nuclear transport factor 2 family protein n=1 Tax=Novosphingobium sp. JCM 18896 TaxID=2989731 RepID=UPI00222290CC|nr:nuclear transport factor 2 family protein [Novosphingobium sp. JCM 18896]MCW1429693.1 nuclear transport factor 2 family protein [Novosphingobium sp. JCM 18896]
MATDPAATLDFVKSRIDILDCVNRYTRGMDRLDRDSALSAFHADAQLEYGVFVGSPAEFFDYFAELHRHHHKSTNHNICNHVCELDGDTAHTETYFAVANIGASGDFALAGGRYVDRFERRDGRWAIATRVCVGEWDATPGGNPMAETMIAKFREIVPIARDSSDVSYQRPLAIPAERLGMRMTV